MKRSVNARIRNSRVGYLLRVITHLYRLPRYVFYFEEHQKQLSEELTKHQQLLEHSVEKTETWHKTQSEKNELTARLIGKLDDRVAELNHKLANADFSVAHKNTAPAPRESGKELLADNHVLDRFYAAFEDRHRGSEEDIKQRLEIYLDYFRTLPNDKGLPVIDLGCGRGELLSLLHDHSIRSIGVDLNQTMVQRAQSKGYEAVQDDAVGYLTQQAKNSIIAVTGFHLVEHMPFPLLMRMFEESYRVIQPGGFVLFETPNPENLVVGACNFYMDPSHLNPLPPALLAFALETAGFNVEILRLHPVKEKNPHKSELMRDIANSLYGARDYAVIGRKERL